MALRDVVIVGWNDNGFWEADIYKDVEVSPSGAFDLHGSVSDGFITMSRHLSKLEASGRAAIAWPTALIQVADDETDDGETDDD